jgi:hypothetical protein
LLKNDDNWALVSDKAAERYQKNGAEAAALALKPVGTTNEEKGECDDDDDDDDEEEEEDEEEEQPWAPHGPIWLPRSLPQRFSKLTHLHLVKPHTGETRFFLAHDSYAHIPHHYEQILNKEWVFLLQAVAGILNELILEHRIPMRMGDTIGEGDPHPEPKRSSVTRSLRPWDSSEPDRGD